MKWCGLLDNKNNMILVSDIYIYIYIYQIGPQNWYNGLSLIRRPTVICTITDFATNKRSSVMTYVPITNGAWTSAGTMLTIDIHTIYFFIVTPHELVKVSNYRQNNCLFNSFFKRASNKTSKLHTSGPLWRIPQINGRFPSVVAWRYQAIT